MFKLMQQIQHDPFLDSCYQLWLIIWKKKLVEFNGNILQKEFSCQSKRSTFLSKGKIESQVCNLKVCF